MRRTISWKVTRRLASTLMLTVGLFGMSLAVSPQTARADSDWTTRKYTYCDKDSNTCADITIWIYKDGRVYDQVVKEYRDPLADPDYPDPDDPSSGPPGDGTPEGSVRWMLEHTRGIEGLVGMSFWESPIGTSMTDAGDGLLTVWNPGDEENPSCLVKVIRIVAAESPAGIYSPGGLFESNGDSVGKQVMDWVRSNKSKSPGGTSGDDDNDDDANAQGLGCYDADGTLIHPKALGD